MVNSFLTSYKSLIIFLMIAFISNFLGFDFFSYFFIYLINFLWLTVKINENITFVKKIILTAVIFFISTISIFYFDGIGKSLYRYTIVFAFVLIYFIANSFIKKNNKISF